MADEPKKTAPKKPIQVKIIPSLEPKLGRVYSNYVQVSHSKYEFTIRFGDAPPGGDVERLMKGNKLTIPNIIEIVPHPVFWTQVFFKRPWRWGFGWAIGLGPARG